MLRAPCVALVCSAVLMLAPGASSQARVRTLSGEAPGDFFGYAVAGAGDVDQDGYEDVLVGAVYYLTTRGYVRLLSGRDGSVLHAYDEVLNGTGLGSGLAGGADVDGDGFPDFAVGAYWDSITWHYGGSVRVYSGADGTRHYTLGGPSQVSWFGLRVEFCGDVDGDGLPDLIAGSFGDSTAGHEAGSARVYRGYDGALLHTFLGDAPGAEFGRDVSGAGDIDGDGHADLLVSGYDSNVPTYPGVTRIYSGRDGAVLREHLAPLSAGFGHSIAHIGDLDGDGVDEYAIGAHVEGIAAEHHLPRGSVRVFSGASGALLYHWWGEPYSTFGFSVDGAGDVNGDGVPDVVVGAPNVIAPGGQGHFVRVFSGADGALLFQDSAPIDPHNQHGNAVARGGDVNGDGLDDVLVADYAGDAAGSNAGTVYVLGGECPAPDAYCDALPNSTGAGAQLLHTGGPSVSATDLAFGAEGLPPGELCMLLSSPARDATPLGHGLRCVGSPAHRLGPPRFAGREGNLTSAFMHESDAVPADPGSTQHYQLWYRDAAAGGAAFNFSDAVAVRFCP